MGKRLSGKHQRHPQRKRTMFTEKQLEDLKILFNKNPYPNTGLQKEMAFKMGIRPTVLQVWFKNHRAKLKKAKYKHIQQKQQGAQQQQLPEEGVKTSPSKRNTDTSHRAPAGVCPASLVYTDHPAPSFQLSICPNFRVPADHSVGHKIVHFGCCQDPNIYFLHPIFEPQIPPPSLDSNSFVSSSLQRT
ncbi:divergent paired-related homeobox [Choloepus didactylus]|uniref:divergent paired-related homeobox n=1 Tax=Choloepus didactylus TaxID=27675 RepID=UPI00189DB657|nr:divergent paired-related homeobox [Choloepus didactylus]